MGELAKLFNTESKKFSKKNSKQSLIAYVQKEMLGIKDFNVLAKRLLVLSMSVADADGGTFYLEKDKGLELYLSLNRSLNLEIKPTKSGKKRTIPIYDKKTNKPIRKFATVRAYIDQKSVNIDDMKSPGLELSASKQFDKMHSYKTKSILSVPLISNKTSFGVLQLINANTSEGENAPPFQTEVVEQVESICEVVASLLFGQYQDKIEATAQKEQKAAEKAAEKELQSAGLPSPPTGKQKAMKLLIYAIIIILITIFGYRNRDKIGKMLKPGKSTVQEQKAAKKAPKKLKPLRTSEEAQKVKRKKAILRPTGRYFKAGESDSEPKKRK
ncbi:GAF domain-containing protein [Candidatus Margulisiibacteriota bacterium]